MRGGLTLRAAAIAARPFFLDRGRLLTAVIFVGDSRITNHAFNLKYPMPQGQTIE